MTEALDMPATSEPVRIDQDLILELNFVPKWARKPPTQHAYFDERHERESARHDSDRERFDRRHGPRPDRREGPRGDRRDGPRPDRGPGRERSFRPPVRRDDAGARRPEPARAEERREVLRPPPAVVESLPVSVNFLPLAKGLSFLVHKIHATRRAFPLMELSNLFLSNPHYCDVKVESRRDEGRLRLYQCKRCRMVASDRAVLVGHLIQAHLADFLVREEVLGDPPSGEFVCVARCGLSGELLGPPNHHSFAARLQELHRTRFSHLSIDAFRDKVEMVRDKDLIEKWREESRRKVVYRPKSAPEGTGPNFTWTEAEAYVADQLAPHEIVDGFRMVLPMDAARAMEDERLREAIRQAWRRESRFPRSLPFALRGAFKHMHLHMFKAGEGETFVCAVAPAPLDPARAVESIREVLTYLQGRPGCTREQMIAALRPGKDAASAEVGELLRPLGWLIEKGHIIEFFDGTLAVPLSAG